MKSRRVILGLAGAMVLVGAAPRRAGAPGAGSRPKRLARALGRLNMDELLRRLVFEARGSLAPELARLAMTDLQAGLAEEAVACARRAQDQQVRDALMDEAIGLYDGVIAATRGAGDHPGRLRHERFRLARLRAEGLIKAEPYVERIQYFLARDGDRRALERLTGDAMRGLDRACDRLDTLAGTWRDDHEAIVTGAADAVEALAAEAHYRAAHIRLYRALALPTGSRQRRALLTQAVRDAREFISGDFADRGVTNEALLLAGMATAALAADAPDEPPTRPARTRPTKPRG